MKDRTILALRLSMLLAVVWLPAFWAPVELGAQDWVAQTYTVSARLEADAESLAFPGRRDQILVLPEDVVEPEVCVAISASAAPDRGRTRVVVVIRRVGDDGEDRTIQRLEFEWRQTDPPLLGSRCQPVPSLLAGDSVEFRFRFFDMAALELGRRGRRIATLPMLTVTGTVRHDPTRG